jgi:hypothetical protein
MLFEQCQNIGHIVLALAWAPRWFSGSSKL